MEEKTMKTTPRRWTKIDIFVVTTGDYDGPIQFDDYHEFDSWDEASEFIYQILINTNLICSVSIQTQRNMSEVELLELKHKQKIRKECSDYKTYISKSSEGRKRLRDSSGI
jgi:hypothetical protein